MSASEAKFLISFTGYKADCFTVTKFSGEDEISRSYRFDIKFKLSEAIPSPWPSGGKPVLTAAALLGKPCHFKIMGSKNDLAAAYHGVIMAFDVEHGFDSKSNPAAPAYSLRLVPWIELLSLSTNNRVFQKLKAVDIIQKVIEEAVQEAAKDAELKEYCKFRLECGDKGKRKADIAYNEIDLRAVSGDRPEFHLSADGAKRNMVLLRGARQAGRVGVQGGVHGNHGQFRLLPTGRDKSAVCEGWDDSGGFG